MHVEIIPNRNSHPTIILREAHRQGKKIVKTKIANLTNAISLEQALQLRAVFKGDTLVSLGQGGETLAMRTEHESLPLRPYQSRAGRYGPTWLARASGSVP
jgi:hypothetical protein